MVTSDRFKISGVYEETYMDLLGIIAESKDSATTIHDTPLKVQTHETITETHIVSVSYYYINEVWIATIETLDGLHYSGEISKVYLALYPHLGSPKVDNAGNPSNNRRIGQ